MATAPVIEEPRLALVPVNNAAAAVVLFDNAKFDAFYTKLKADVDAVPVDLTTRKGREAIASVAAKVRTEKASIDKDRLRLTKEWRDMTAQVNGAWNVIKDQLDTLAVEARKPLTEWEQAEEARANHCRSIIDGLKAMAVVTMDDTASVVRERGMVAWGAALDPDVFGDMLDEAVAAKDTAVVSLKSALTRLEREEAERAELEKLRAEAAEQAEADRLAAEQARRDADKAHRSKIMSATKTAIMSCGADEETAKKIVLTIIAGEIPNVTLRF